MKLDLDGEKALGRAFHEFPRKFAAKAIKRVLRDTMKQVVLPKAKADVPKDEGDLRKSIRVRTAKGSRGQRLPRTVMGSAVVVLERVTHAKYVLFDRRLRDGRIRPGDRSLREALFDQSIEIRAKVTAGLRKALPMIANEVRGLK